MPRFDGTGPNGEGSKTGRGLGSCVGNNNSNAKFGQGLRRGQRNGNGAGRVQGRQGNR